MMPAGFILRPMKKSDAEALANLAAEIMPFAWNAALFASSCDEYAVALVLQKHTLLLGFVIARVYAQECELLNIGVASGYQGQGLGHRLLQSLLEQVYALGAMQVWLEVRCSNQKAIDFYKGFGFVKTGERKDYYPTEQGRESACIMHLNKGVGCV